MRISTTPQVASAMSFLNVRYETYVQELTNVPKWFLYFVVNSLLRSGAEICQIQWRIQRRPVEVAGQSAK